MVEAEEGSSWIYKNKDHGKSIERNDQPADQVSDPALHPSLTGMMSAAASLGVSMLWDTDVGLSHIDKYMYSSEEFIKVRLCSSTSARCS